MLSWIHGLGFKWFVFRHDCFFLIMDAKHFRIFVYKQQLCYGILKKCVMKIEDRISRTIKVHKVICCDSSSVCRIGSFSIESGCLKLSIFIRLVLCFLVYLDIEDRSEYRELWYGICFFILFIELILWVLDFVYLPHFSVGAQKVKNTCIQFREFCQSRSRDGLVPSIICICYYFYWHF